MTPTLKRIIRDTAIVWVATALGGLAVGFAFGLLGQGQSPKLALAVAFTNIVFGIVAFAIVGYLTETDRLRHIATIVGFVWVLGLLNVALFGFTITQWAASLVVLSVVSAIGGGIAWLIRRLGGGANGRTAA